MGTGAAAMRPPMPSPPSSTSAITATFQAKASAVAKAGTSGCKSCGTISAV